MKPLATGLLLLALVAGCGGSAEEPERDRRHASPAEDQGRTLQDFDRRSQALVGDHVSTPWVLLKGSTDDTLVLRAESGGCIEFLRVVVDERADSVLIASLGRDHALEPPPEGQSEVICPANLGYTRATVRLAMPLGGRELLHAPVSMGELRR